MDAEKIKIKNKLRKVLAAGKIKKCLYCEKEVKKIEAHTIQNNKYLNKLNDNGKVYTMFQSQLETANLEIDFVEIGRKSFGTFSGFCSEHDNSLFEAIEKDNCYIKTKEQNFMFAFRCFSYYYHKYLEMEKTDKVYLKRHYNVEKDSPLIYSQIMYRRKNIYPFLSYMKRNLDFFKKGILEKKFNTLFTKIIEFSGEKKIVTSSCFIPNQYAGKEIRTKSFELPFIYFSIFFENNKTYVLVSCFKHHKKFLRKFLKKFNKKGKELEFFLTDIIFNNCIDLSGFSKDYFNKHVIKEKILVKIKEKMKDNNFKIFNTNLFSKVKNKKVIG